MTFFMFLGILGTFHFSFFGLRGGRKFLEASRRGGAKNFGRFAKGGEKFGPPIFFLIQGVNEYALKK